MTSLAVFWIVAALAAPDETYAWPLELPRVVTGTFAEYRGGGRFHAGLDLRTGGIGQPVHAPTDGYVMKVRCSPWGYGKAVYLKLDDGHVVVFGHLSKFNGPLAEYVRKIQHARKSYSVDLEPDPATFRFKKGDTVAFSGDTGIGPAHLHYEIRDDGERPLNHRLLGVTWPDDTPPTFRRLLVMPSGPDSTVNGDIAPVILPLHSDGNGVYTCGPIRASGNVGFGLDLTDPANEGANQLGIHVLRTQVGDEELFRVQNDRISYDTIHNEVVSYHPFVRDGDPFLLQWRWPGNAAECFGVSNGDGWLRVADSPRTVHLEAIDFLDNKASVNFTVAPDNQPAPDVVSATGSEKGFVAIECVGTWLMLTATFPKPEPEAPALAATGPKPIEGGVFRRSDARTFRAGFMPAKEARDVMLRVTHPRLTPFGETYLIFQRGAPDRSESLAGLTLKVQGKSPFGTMFARVETATHVPASPLPMIGHAYRIMPTDTPIDAPVEISLPFPRGAAKPDRVSIYRASGTGWSCEDTRRADAILTISSRRFGVFAAMEDNQPPTITDISLKEGQVCDSRRPTIHAIVKDIGSGIRDVTVTCGDTWLLAEYDPEADLVTWAKDEDLPEGPQTLTFRAVDGVGNSTTVARAIKIGVGDAPRTEKPTQQKAPQKKAVKKPAKKSQSPPQKHSK